MADKIVLVDTSILIDLFRKTDKANAVLPRIHEFDKPVRQRHIRTCPSGSGGHSWY